MFTPVAGDRAVGAGPPGAPRRVRPRYQVGVEGDAVTAGVRADPSYRERAMARSTPTASRVATMNAPVTGRDRPSAGDTMVP